MVTVFQVCAEQKRPGIPSAYITNASSYPFSLQFNRGNSHSSVFPYRLGPFKGIYLCTLKQTVLLICSDSKAAVTETVQEAKSYCPNLQAVVAFPKILADLFCSQNDILSLRKHLSHIMKVRGDIPLKKTPVFHHTLIRL